MIFGHPNLAFRTHGRGQDQRFWNGLALPLGGLDHLCAKIGVGLWAVQRGSRAIRLVPLAFVLVMALGGYNYYGR